MLYVATVVVLVWCFVPCMTRNPPGHLQPLGRHRPPSGQIETLDTMLSPEDFYQRYVLPGRPVVLSGAARLSPAYHRWTDRYLSQRHANEEAEVDSSKKERADSYRENMRMDEFLQQYNQSEMYMLDRLPKGMMEEVYLPPCLSCGGFTRHLHDIRIWMSSGGTKSTFHMDNMENIICMYSGRKDWLLVDSEVGRHTLLHHTDGTEDFSVDVDRVDMYKYPSLRTIPWWSARIERGDCLYLPHRWLHFVQSYGRNLAVNIWWTPISSFDYSDCTARDSQTPVRLSELELKQGEQIRYVIRVYLEEYGGKLPKDMVQAQVIYDEVVITDWVFKGLDTNRDGWLTVEEINNLPVETIEDLLPDVYLEAVHTFGRCEAYNNTATGVHTFTCASSFT
ncbi:bifunctional peptidase and arginyl-hydroxylase JMJD5-like [Branchiostoma floridae x Branchiostoma belcheri]